VSISAARLSAAAANPAAEWLCVPRNHIEVRKAVTPELDASSASRPPRKAARAATTGTSRRGRT
jgi:hypothetical protein